MSRPVSKFAEWLARASIHDKFGICGILTLLCWMCYSLGRRFSHLPLRLQQVSWRSFFQAPTPGLLQWLDIPSYLQGGVLTVLLIANIIVISLHARTWADVQKRAGCLAVTHLVPLCSGFSFSLPAHVYYVEGDTFYWAHRWLGRICVLHCLLHGSVLGANARNTSLGAPIAIPLLVREAGPRRAAFPCPRSVSDYKWLTINRPDVVSFRSCLGRWLRSSAGGRNSASRSTICLLRSPPAPFSTI